MEINQKLLETITKNLFKVEFNEKQQHFHLSSYSKHLESSHGWVEIFSCVDDREFKIFTIFLESNYEKPYNLKDLHLCAEQISSFHSMLIEKNYDILPVIS